MKGNRLIATVVFIIGCLFILSAYPIVEIANEKTMERDSYMPENSTIKLDKEIESAYGGYATSLVVSGMICIIFSLFMVGIYFDRNEDKY